MELVGRAVKKTFQGLGTFSGIVDSYDSSSGFFKILYEDGESEEIDSSGVASILQGAEQEQITEEECRGRKPKKRRRAAKGMETSSGNSGNLLDTQFSDSGLQEIQLGNGSFDRGFLEIEENGTGRSRNLDNFKSVEATEGVSACLELSQLTNGGAGCAVSLEGRSFGNLIEHAVINGNLEGNVSLRRFEETQMKDGSFNGNLAGNASSRAVDGTQMGVFDLGRGSVGNTLSGIVEETKMEGGGINGNSSERNSMHDEEIRIEESKNSLLGALGNGEMVGGSSVQNWKGNASGVCKETQVEDCDLGEDLNGNAASGAVKNAEIKNCRLDGSFKENASSCVVEDTETRGHGLKEVLKDNGSYGAVDDMETNCGDFDGNFKENVSPPIAEEYHLKDFGGEEEKTASLGAVGEKTSGFDGDLKGNVSHGSAKDAQIKDSCFHEFQLKEGDSNILIVENHRKESDFGGTVMEEQGRRKRRKLSRKLKSTPQMVLRRSSRRATVASSSSPNLVADVEALPSVNAVPDGICVGSAQIELKEVNNPSSKLELPPSSKNLNIDGLPMLKLFSIYSCLRSFSTVLFLSPFGLEAFVAALKCNLANSLIDSIHLSILQALKLHLEFLSNEGSDSASDCLRNINWEFLDLITWPVYLAEYLIFCGAGLKSSFELCHSKLLNGEYYKQSPSVKLEILCCLCDDVVEVEVIRSELSRRTSSSDFDMDIDRIVNVESCSKRMNSMDDLVSSCVTQEVVDGSADPNNDECCLCKMDGSLICCDGCPAAYHSRCVGMTKDLLPEGDWYCPECMMDKQDGWMRSSRSLKGAELLGIDPHGRLYFALGSYLLVSDSADAESSYYYYNRDDVNVVIEALKSSDACGSILSAICMQWDTPLHTTEGKSHFEGGATDMAVDSETCAANMLSPLPTCLKLEAVGDRKPKEGFTAIFDDSNRPECVASEPIRLLGSGLGYVNQLMEITSPFASSEGSAEMPQAGTCILVAAQETEADHHGKSDVTQLIEHKVPEETHAASTPFVMKPSQVLTSQMQVEPGCYVNYYSFGQMVSSVAEELASKSPDCIKEDSKRPPEEIVSIQLKAISKKSTRFFWPSIQKLYLDSQKEKCGWCFSCKNTSDRDCLFNMTFEKVLDGVKVGAVGFRSKRSCKSHLSSVKHHILSIEDRLQGLLSGPWEMPHHSKQWRKNVLKASDVASVKNLLLILEENLRRVVLSMEWLKQVDYTVTVGSASHVLGTSENVSSKHGGGRKRSRKNNSDAASNFVPTVSGIYWWRGGRLSREVFHWKMLPRALASKGGRQAGCRKIPGILYPDGSELSKRPKFIAWRAAVEMSISVAQLAYQVRDIDSNIKWNDLVNTQFFPQLTKQSKKLPLKKVTIRRKCIEGTDVKYLLDFGKRKTIPDTVTKYGVMLEEPSSERKKFWLNEYYVPLKLLKAYEEKKQVRANIKTSPGLLDGGSKTKKPSRPKGLSHILSKAEKEVKCHCGHCNRDVLLREAVSCQFCKGFFHKKHANVSKGANNGEHAYACYKCQDKKHVKLKIKSLNVQPEGNKVATKSLKKRSEGTKVTAKSLAVRLAGRKVTADSLKIHAEKRNIMTRSHKIDLERRKVTAKSCKAQLRMTKITAKSCNAHAERTTMTTGRCEGQSERTEITTKCPQPEMTGISEIRRSQRSLKKVNYALVAMQSSKLVEPKKGSKIPSNGNESNESNDDISWCKGKRTRVLHAYWLKGLLWTQKACDQRAIQFRRHNVLLRSRRSIGAFQQPSCSLCHEEYDSGLTYIACEICGDWFHGDTFGLSMKNCNHLLGFKCYNCLKRRPPVCPHSKDVLINGTQSHNEESNEPSAESVKDLPEDNEAQLLNEKSNEPRAESVKDLSKDNKCSLELNGGQGSSSKEDHLVSEGEEPVCKKQQIDTVSGSNQAIAALKEEPIAVRFHEGAEVKSLSCEYDGEATIQMTTEQLEHKEEIGLKDIQDSWVS